MMNREAFEKLVSEWLDKPERDGLRAAVDAAATASPELGRLKDEWVRLDQLIRGLSSGVDHVDWSRFRQHIGNAVDQNGTDAKLDEQMRSLTAVEQRVDWSRLHKRICRAVGRADDRARVIRFPLRRVAAGVLLTGAAAALVLMFTLPAKSPTTYSGVARVRVSSPAEALQPLDQKRGFAQVTISPPPDAEEAIDEAKPSRSEATQPQLAEVFLMVEPVRVAARTRGSLTPFGFN